MVARCGRQNLMIPIGGGIWFLSLCRSNHVVPIRVCMTPRVNCRATGQALIALRKIKFTGTIFPKNFELQRVARLHSTFLILINTGERSCEKFCAGLAQKTESPCHYRAVATVITSFQSIVRVMELSRSDRHSRVRQHQPHMRIAIPAVASGFGSFNTYPIHTQLNPHRLSGIFTGLDPSS